MKKKSAILCFYCLFCSFVLFSQKTDNPPLSEADKQEIQKTEKYAQGIAHQMFNLLGGIDECPTVIIRADDAIASYTYHEPTNKKTIRIDARVTLNIIKTFGEGYDDCLAIIIGHELWHAVHHKESGNFGDPGIKEMFVAQETDSDFYGLLAAQMAGYTAAFANYDALLNMLSPKAGSDHPVIAQRLNGDNNVAMRMDSILPLYKIGTYNLLMGGASELGRAEACFKAANARLENGNEGIEFPQFNYQLGVVNFSRALLAYGQPWVFPLEAYDASFLTPKLRGGGDGTTDPVQLKISLDASDRYFQKILHINPNHWDARLGMACVATLRVAIDGNIPTANQTIAQLVADLNTELNKFPTPQKAEWEKKHVLTLKEMKDKAALLQCLVPIIPEKSADAVKKKASTDLEQLCGTTTFLNVRGFAAVNIRLLAGNEEGKTSVFELSLPERDGLNDNNWKTIIPTLSSQNLISTDNIGGVMLKKYRLNSSNIIVYGSGLSTYVFQEYDTCPLYLSTVDAAGGLDRTGTGNYRYFDNPTGGHSVIIDLGIDPKKQNKQKIESCVKIFKKKL